MKHRAYPSFVLTLAALGLAACGSDPAAPPPPGPDASMHDVSGADVMRDTGTPDRTPVDRPTVASQCPALPDLEMATPSADGTVRVQGSNGKSELNRFGTLRSGCVVGGVVGRRMVYAYTMRGDGALRVSTVNPGTRPATFDTVVSVHGTCISTSRSLACNDNAMGVATANARHSTAVTGPLTEGQRVYIVVGGRGTNEENITTGDFELTVREIRSGTLDGPCRLTDEACDTGLLCTVLAPTIEAQGVCRRPVAVGATCRAGDLCVRNAACIANVGDNTVGTCRMDATDGGACLVGRAACGAGLSCTNPTPTPDATGLCRPTRVAGESCDAGLFTGVCTPGTSCRTAPTAREPGRMICLATGTRGGLCRATEPRCDMGLECSAGTVGTCRAQVTRGAGCDVSGNANFCESGTSCAIDEMFLSGACAANGSAPGTTCRDAEPRCDPDLSCAAVGGRNVCRRTATGDAPCDWRYGSVACAEGSRCLPGGVVRGLCTAVTPEVEPNNTPATAQTFTSSGIIVSSITAATDIDCIRVTVPMGATLFAETSDGAGGCPAGADTVLTLFNAAGTRIAENNDISATNRCSRINGLAPGSLPTLAPGVYAACARALTASMNYQLALSVVAP